MSRGGRVGRLLGSWGGIRAGQGASTRASCGRGRGYPIRRRGETLGVGATHREAESCGRRRGGLAGLLPLETLGVAPDLLEGIVGAGLGGEDVDDEVAVVDQDPAARLRAFHAEF